MFGLPAETTSFSLLSSVALPCCDRLEKLALDDAVISYKCCNMARCGLVPVQLSEYFPNILWPHAYGAPSEWTGERGRR